MPIVSFNSLLILGLLQGLTEFLPVSSSGHLAVLGYFFRLKETQLAWTIALHAGTLLSILVFFRGDLREIVYSVFFPSRLEAGDVFDGRKTVWFLLIATIPAALAGFFLYERIKVVCLNVNLVLGALFLNGCWLFICERAALKKKVRGGVEKIGVKEALLIGVGQAVALIPGISRSGATIGTGYFLGLKKETAFTLSFLLAIPATLGAILLSWGDVIVHGLLPLLFLVLFTAAVGYAALFILSGVVKKNRLSYFSWYCWFMAGLGALLFNWKGN